MKTPHTLSARAAAVQVLHAAGTPLHYQEITNRVLAAGLWKTEGETPNATIRGVLGRDVKTKGSASAFRRAGRGLFTLNTESGARQLQPSQHAPKQTMPEKSTSGTRPLVLGYLERIASHAFSEFPRQITDLVEVNGKHGVYALYKGDHLYYVGLATNLRTRIKQHLRDRHAAKWNRFSLYLVRKVEHIRELEAMILRIADPTGNSTRGGLPGAQNLWGELRATIRKEQDRQIRTISYSKTSRPRPARSQIRPPEPRPARRPPVLAAFNIRDIKQLRAHHKKQTLTARVATDGTIEFNREVYNSPSMAGAAAVNRKTCSGWTFWEYERAPDDWVKLDYLRKK